MAKFEIVPLVELKTRLPAKLLPLVEEYRERLEKLGAEQRANLVLEKGDDPKDLRKGAEGSCRVAEPAEAVAPMNQAALLYNRLLEKEDDNAERGRDFRFV